MTEQKNRSADGTAETPQTDLTVETPPADPNVPITHVYVLLDRSGSMEAIADDVIGGFNRLVADQKANGPDARMTLVQFDGDDPQEVLADAVPITEMAPLDRHTFVPRSTTPLLDATGRLLTRAARRAKVISDSGGRPEEIVIVSITDGHENASREMTLSGIRRMIDGHKADGWSFVFLSAAENVYEEAGGLGYDHRSSQAFDPSADGVELAFDALSSATTVLRERVRNDELFDRADFFEDEKPAEEHRNRTRSKRP